MPGGGCLWVGHRPGTSPRLISTSHYFRTDDSATKFRTLTRYVEWGNIRVLVKKRGRMLRADLAARWTRTWFHDKGLHQLMGTIRYPKAA